MPCERCCNIFRKVSRTRKRRWAIRRLLVRRTLPNTYSLLGLFRDDEHVLFAVLDGEFAGPAVVAAGAQADLQRLVLDLVDAFERLVLVRRADVDFLGLAGGVELEGSLLGLV